MLPPSTVGRHWRGWGVWQATLAMPCPLDMQALHHLGWFSFVFSLGDVPSLALCWHIPVTVTGLVCRGLRHL